MRCVFRFGRSHKSVKAKGKISSQSGQSPVMAGQMSTSKTVEYLLLEVELERVDEDEYKWVF